MTAPDASRPSYRADVDGLRAVAVAAVVLFHTFPERLRGGFIGVDVFFVISGFVITSVLLAAMADGRFRVSHFYARRIRRIFPVLILVLAAVAVHALVFYLPAEASRAGRYIVSAATFLPNILLWNEAGYFGPAAEEKPLLHLWSLGVEEQFYILWPLILAVAVKNFRSRAFHVCVGIALVSFAANAVDVTRVSNSVFFLPQYRAWELLMGAALAFLVDKGPLRTGGCDRPALRHLIALIGALLIGIGCVRISAGRPFPGWWALMPAVGAAAIIWAGPAALINRHVLSNRVMVYLGLISYPIYMWHWVVVKIGDDLLLSLYRGAQPDPVATRLAEITVTLILSALSYHLMEIRLRRSERVRDIVALCGILAVTGCAGIALWHFGNPHGNPARDAFLAGYDPYPSAILAKAYRRECDFATWAGAEARRSGIDPACVTANGGKTVLLWGDSHGQHLSLGLRNALAGRGLTLLQITTSACPPELRPRETGWGDTPCDRSNAFAAETIERLRPDLVIVARKNDHQGTDWADFAARLRDTGGSRLLLVGPAPQWSRALPQIVVRYFWDDIPEAITSFRNPSALRTDLILSRRYSQSSALSYVSLIQGLCSQGGCPVMVPGTSILTAIDYGHFTPEASDWVAASVLAPNVFRLLDLPGPDAAGRVPR